MNDELDKTEELFRALQQEVEGKKPTSEIKYAIQGSPENGENIIKYFTDRGAKNLDDYEGTVFNAYYYVINNIIKATRDFGDPPKDYTTIIYSDLPKTNSQPVAPIKQVYFKGTHNVQQRKALISYLESLGFSNSRELEGYGVSEYYYGDIDGEINSNYLPPAGYSEITYFDIKKPGCPNCLEEGFELVEAFNGTKCCEDCIDDYEENYECNCCGELSSDLDSSGYCSSCFNDDEEEEESEEDFTIAPTGSSLAELEDLYHLISTPSKEKVNITNLVTKLPMKRRK